MKVILTIPYWGTDPLRERNFEWVYQHVSGLYDWWNIGTGTFGSYPTRGGTRNAAVRWAQDHGADVVVLCDADTFPEEGALCEGVAAAYVNGGLHFLYDKYRALNVFGTGLLMSGHPERAVEHLESQTVGGLGGVMAIRPDQWWEAGGSPELDGWGFEDVIFAVQARTLLATDCAWHPGWITHLYHPTECRVGSEEYNRNIQICKQYEEASWDKEAIRKLLRERT